MKSANLPVVSGASRGTALFPPPGEILLPEALTGKEGAFRTGAPNLLNVDDDLAAMSAFIARRPSPNTRRAYEHELTRLWYWAIDVQRKPISSLRHEDYLDFVAFLKDPQPPERWIGPVRKRTDPEWRPFLLRPRAKRESESRDADGNIIDANGNKVEIKSPLTLDSIDLSMTIIKAMLEFWFRSHYIRVNPLMDWKKLAPMRKREIGSRKYLNKAQWKAVVDYLESMPQKTRDDRAKWLRDRYLVYMLCLLGLRIVEIVKESPNSLTPATHRQFSYTRGSDNEVLWWLTVVGKGNKERIVPVSHELMSVVSELRQFHGYPAYPSTVESDPLPLLPPLHLVSGRPACEQGITARRANDILSEIFLKATDLLIDENDKKAMRYLSAHSFRHTSVSRDMNEYEVDADHVRIKHGHASLDTTMIYFQKEVSELHRRLTRRRIKD